jgi:hypothetical protein
VESSDDDGDIKLKLEGMGADGSWTTLSDRPIESKQWIRTSLRQAATQELKSRGIRYVVIKPDNPGADDFRLYPAYWGLTLVGSTADTRLFRIQ